MILHVLRSQALPFDESQLEYGEVNGLRICIKVGEDIINNPQVVAQIQNEIDKVNEKLDDFETIKKFKILNRRLSEEAGEITPSAKIKTKVVMERYADIIESLY